MLILYLTNKTASNRKKIPNFIQKNGDKVIIRSNKVSKNFLKKNKIDFIISDRYTYIIKSNVINYLKKKVINFHNSFLPLNRGYHPLFWAIYKKTPLGVTIHLIDEGIDTGRIIYQKKIKYRKEDTLRSLYDKQRAEFYDLFVKNWKKIKNGKFKLKKNPKEKGSIMYKKDNKLFINKLKKGWDTTVKDVQRMKI